MFCALVGGVSAMLLLAGAHDRQIARLPSTNRRWRRFVSRHASRSWRSP